MASSVQEEYDEAEESIKQHDRSRSFFCFPVIRSGLNESDAESGLLGKNREKKENKCDWGNVGRASAEVRNRFCYVPLSWCSLQSGAIVHRWVIASED